MDILLLGIGIIITLIAQLYVTSSYNKYNKYKTKNGITGFEVARKILDSHGLNSVYIVETKGMLSDHYDPSAKVVRLSSNVFHGNSIASCSVAAHEVGHAIQDQENYSFMKIRGALFPIVNFSSYAGYFAIVIGAVFKFWDLIWLGIALELIILLFQLVTLPVEFNASNRAMQELQKNNILVTQELKHSKTMLTAAALTYVASVINTIFQILRLILIYGGKRND